VKFCIPRRGASTNSGLGPSAPPSLCPPAFAVAIIGDDRGAVYLNI